MTLHKLSAGDGYTYLTRQVASADVERTGPEALADYYTAKGEAPGHWRGAGAATLGVSGQVHERQMVALFGEGLHPQADEIIATRMRELTAQGVTGKAAYEQALAATRLGTRFYHFGPGGDWPERLRAAYHQAAINAGQPLNEADRAQVRQAFTAAAFEAEHSRAPRDDAELVAWTIRQAAPQRVAVAGFDLVFTPVKSVSVLWALGDAETRTEVEAAHAAAVNRALTYVEGEAALTRTGRNGIAQVDTSGLTIAAFDHRDSRAGEPNLHTHAAVSTKVRSPDRRWRALDARVLHAAAVSASETYNTAIEDELVARLGVRFTARGGARAATREGLREVREVLGVDPRLSAAFSSRRSAIEARLEELIGGYRAEHGHEPPAVVRQRLAQQATLATREGKAEPRSLAEQRTDWLATAREVLALPEQLPAVMVEALITQNARPHTVGREHSDIDIDHPAGSSALRAGAELTPAAGSAVRLAGGASVRLDDLELQHYQPPVTFLEPPPAAEAGSSPVTVDAVGGETSGWSGPNIGQVAALVLASTEAHHATWTRFTLHAEAQRRLRRLAPLTGPLEAAAREDLTRQVVDVACAAGLALSAPGVNSQRPPELTRADGESVFTVHGATRWSSTRILDAEEALLAAATRRVRAPAQRQHVHLAARAAIAGAARHGRAAPDAAQLHLAEVFATSPRLLEVGIGAAGTGKTTAMRVMSDAVHAAGGRVIALAPSAAAASVLGDQLGVHAETIHTFQLLAARTERGGSGLRVRAGDVLLVDEAGMAGTLRLRQITDFAARRGAVVRLLGDPQQLSAVESGGALRLLEHEGRATMLRDVHRFSDPAEAAASLAVREGKNTAIAFYRDCGRLDGGTREAMMDTVYAAWRADTGAGHATVMLAGSTDVVAHLSAHARADRILAGEVDTSVEVDLHDGNQASAGDLIVTRRNERMLITHAGRDFVKNGDVWVVQHVTDDGGLRVVHRDHHGPLTLPADYVRADTELAYASTVHRAQGMTVTTAHLLVDESTTREALYVGLTRGRDGNYAYAVTDATDPAHVDHPVPGTAPTPASAAEEVFARALRAESAERPATEVMRGELDHAAALHTLVPAYEHALGLNDEIRYSLTAAVRAGLTDHTHGSPAANLAVLAAADVLEHTAWPTIARSLAAHARTGADPAAALAEAINSRELDSAYDPVLILAWRLEQGAPSRVNEHQRGGLPSWLAPPPDLDSATGRGHPATLDAWLEEQAQAIAQRIDTHVDLALIDQPHWLQALGPRPGDASGGRAWTRTLRDIVAWRDQHQINDPAQHPTGLRDPLGTRPSGPSMRTWDHLDHQLRDLSQQTHDTVGTRQGGTSSAPQRARAAAPPERERSPEVGPSRPREADTSWNIGIDTPER